MSPFLFALYQTLKGLVRICLRLYYPYFHLKNPERLRLEGPTLVVSNHPNTMLDALNGAAWLDRQVFFLANASLFSTAFSNWILNKLYCIPIKRVTDNTRRQTVNNHESFQRSYDHLLGGGSMYIAPEGGSEWQRTLQPLRTGVARIGLGAEAEAGFKLGVRILPLGFNYSRAGKAGSHLLIEVGEPLVLADWEEAYRTDPLEAVRSVMAALRERMVPLLALHTASEAQDLLLYQLEDLLQNQQPLTDPTAYFARSQAVLRQLQTHPDEQTAHLQQQLEAYHHTLARHGLHDAGVARPHLSLFAWQLWLGFPIWAYGWLNHVLAYQTPRWLERKLKLYCGYESTVKFLGALLTFPIGYGLQFALVRALAPGPWPWLYLLSLPLSGWVAWRYARYAWPRWAAWRYRRWRGQAPAAGGQLESDRQALLQWISLP